MRVYIPAAQRIAWRLFFAPLECTHCGRVVEWQTLGT
jgi:hypothetical protein